MRIIPAIDLIDGKCVRLTKGDYEQKTIYNEDPLAVAKEFEEAGMKYLHLVDLDGAKAGKVMNWKVIEALTSKTKLQIDFGGGIKTNEEIKELFHLGVTQVNLGSIAVKNPEKVVDWAAAYGEGKIIISADVRNERVAIHGWQADSSVTIFELIENYASRGIHNITCTDIDTDGTLKGPNLNLYKALKQRCPEIRLVASGGVGRIEDVRSLKSIGVDGVIIGKALYEGKIKLTDLNNI
jgi:phosphoribosylformimino-5-aminoimidazole carboxamide ribotide isomerase